MKRPISTIPPRLSKVPDRPSVRPSVAINTNSHGYEYHCTKSDRISGLIVPARPTIIAIFNKLAPRTFPTERSGTPLRAAEMPVTNSGNDVPIATTESPMMIEGTPIFVASEMPVSKSSRLPITIKTAPRMNRNAMFMLDLPFSGGSSSKACDS